MAIKKEELLKYFDDMLLFLANHHWTKRDERAVAIREMIQRGNVLDLLEVSHKGKYFSGESKKKITKAIKKRI